ncbi:MAG: hypothetical protein JSV50_09015, partial [Desulfobacteraceae bacterium]
PGQPQKGIFMKEVALTACSEPLFKAQGAFHELCIIFMMRLLKKRFPWPILYHFQGAKVLPD